MPQRRGTKKSQGRIRKKHEPTLKPPREMETYMRMVETDKPFLFCEDQKKLVALVRKAFERGDIYVDRKQYNAYEAIGNAMFPKILPWQKFFVMATLCTYRCRDDRPRWLHSLCMLARGAGKDGLIAWISLCLVSKFNLVQKYNVDICANNEQQSLQPVKDAIDFLNNPYYKNVNKSSFYWTSERVKGLDNGGEIIGHTNNARGKDGLRSGAVILNEIHEYESYANIDVFLTGLGKKACPRSFYFTTNGHVREGVLDGELDAAENVLNGDSEDDTFFPFICRIDDKAEAFDEACWFKANPSLYYFPDLLEETRMDFKKWKAAPDTLPGFMAKRMNLPVLSSAHAVTEYENIKATNVPIDYDSLKGLRCIVGIDSATIRDFASVSAIFKKDGKIICINHTWVCLKSRDLPRIKFATEFPRLVEMGLVTLVDDLQINPSYITAYIQNLKENYMIQTVCVDDFRYSLFSEELGKIGFSKDAKNLKMVRMSDIARAVPIIESGFLTHQFVFGDNPMLRWAVNNTKVVAWKTKSTGSSDVGAQVYAKIEPKSRKTDPFMSFVHAMTEEVNLKEATRINTSLFRVRSF